MRRILTTALVAAGLIMAMSGTAMANNPSGDPLPVNGEPDCFGARVSHSASDHGLTAKAKIDAIEAALAAIPGVFPAWEAYYAENGISVRTIQEWIRINCSDDPIIPNP